MDVGAARLHVLVELVRLVELVCLCLLRVEPALEELGIVLREDLVALLDLAELELEGADLVVEDLEMAGKNRLYIVHN